MITKRIIFREYLLNVKFNLTLNVAKEKRKKDFFFLNLRRKSQI